MIRIRWPWPIERWLVMRSRQRGRIIVEHVNRARGRRRGRHVWRRVYPSWRETPRAVRRLFGNVNPNTTRKPPR